jgi:hypothetical protein
VVRCTFATSTSDEVIDRFTITDNTVVISLAAGKVLRYISDDDDAPTDVTDQFDITDEEDGKSATLSLLGDNLSGLWGRLEATIDVRTEMQSSPS